MKNIFIWAAMLSLLTVSCGSEKAGNSVDVEDAAEALYVVQNEINGLSSSAGIGYLVYADADHQTQVDCDTAGVPQTGIRRHVFYKHKWHFSIGETNETPFVFFGQIDGHGPYERQNAYFYGLLRELNEGFRRLEKNNGRENFSRDGFVFSLERSENGIRLSVKRYSPDGREIVGAFTEESRLRRNLAACRKYAALMADSLAVYERRAAEQRTFLRNAGLCTEYRKRRREYNRQRKLIFSVYDRRPYEKIKKIVDDNPEILANEALYTPENLERARAEAETAEKCAALFGRRLEKATIAADSMRLRLARSGE